MNHSGKYGEALWKAYLETKGYDVEDAPNYKFYDWDLRATKREADQVLNLFGQAVQFVSMERLCTIILLTKVQIF